ncbi:MAG: hypothetical protein J5598_00340 [Clostridia bacterium]|nr:hypothetical protein [Clostridia bacterium]
MENKEDTDGYVQQVVYRKYLPSDRDILRAIFKEEASYKGKNAGKRELFVICFWIII